MRQRSIEIDGMKHAAPIPAACRIGPLLYTSAINGRGSDNKLPGDLDREVFNCFENMKKVLAAGGMDLGDVIKMSIWVSSDEHRNVINKYWNECWPDPHKRPARHTLETPLRGGMNLQIEIMAVAKELG